MRTRARVGRLGAGLGAGIAIAALAAAPLPATEVGHAAGPVVANPAFAPNAIDAANPAIGAAAAVHVVANTGEGGKTVVTLHVEGLPANRSFGSHLHRDPCATGFGGPHYQAPDPSAPVPGLADPEHEVWLDFTTNAVGRAVAAEVVPFEVVAAARSVVIHQGDHTLPGGGAGQRLACIDVTL